MMNNISAYTRWNRGWFVMLLAVLTLGFWGMPCDQQAVIGALTLAILALFLYMHNRPIFAVIAVLILLTQATNFDARHSCTPYITSSWLASLEKQSDRDSVKKTSERSVRASSTTLISKSWAYAKSKAKWMGRTLRDGGIETLEAVSEVIRNAAEPYAAEMTAGTDGNDDCGRKKCRR